MKKIPVIAFLVTVLLVGSCVTAPSLTFTPAMATSTRQITSIPIPPADTFLPQQTNTLESNLSCSDAFLYKIYMMDEIRGWALALVKASGIVCILHTDDGGETWMDVTNAIYIGHPFFLDGETAWLSLVDPSTNSVNALIKTTDSGISWTNVNQTMWKFENISFSHDFEFEDNQNGWLRTEIASVGSVHMHYYQTRNGGSTWEPVILKAPQRFREDYYFVDEASGEISICYLCYEQFYFDLKRIIYIPRNQSMMLVTSDFGETWQQSELPDFPFNVSIEDIQFSSFTFFSDKEGLLPIIFTDFTSDTSQLFIYGTQDNGFTWQLESDPTTLNHLVTGIGVEFISRSDGFIISRENTSVTHDNGRTWNTILAPDEFKSSETVLVETQRSFIDPATGWVFIKKRSKDTGILLTSILLKTTDGGYTWTEIVPDIKQ